MWIASTFRIKWIDKVNKLETRTRPNWYLRLSDNTLCVFWIRFFFYFFEFWTTISGCLTLNNPHRSTTRSLSKNRLAHTNAAKTRFSLLFISIVASSFTFLCSCLPTPWTVNTEHRRILFEGIHERSLTQENWIFAVTSSISIGECAVGRWCRREEEEEAEDAILPQFMWNPLPVVRLRPRLRPRCHHESRVRQKIPFRVCGARYYVNGRAPVMRCRRNAVLRHNFWFDEVWVFSLLRCVRRTANRESPAEWPQNENGIKIY